MVQKDASEFLTMLFQQMEMKLQGSKQQHLIQECFGGKVASELIAPGHYSEGEDVFSFISVDVKNKKACLHEMCWLICCVANCLCIDDPLCHCSRASRLCISRMFLIISSLFMRTHTRTLTNAGFARGAAVVHRGRDRGLHLGGP